MSEDRSRAGYVKIARSIYDDAAFADGEFSEREAFIWLIMDAAYKPREKRVGNVIVQLERGQSSNSVRFLSDKWKWSKSRVDRYLGRLEARAMIGTDSGTGVNVITICKYDLYQDGPKASGTAAGHERDSSGTKEKEGKELKEDKGGGGSAREAEIAAPDALPAFPPPVTLPDDPTFREQLLDACGADPRSGMTGRGGSRLGTDVQMIEVRKWQDDLGLTEGEIMAEVKHTMGQKRDGPPSTLQYFRPIMQRLAADKKAARIPLQPAQVNHEPAFTDRGPRVHHTRGGRSVDPLTEGFARAAARLATKH